MNPTNYVNTLQHFVKHTHTAHTHTAHNCTHTHIQAKHSESRWERRVLRADLNDALVTVDWMGLTSWGREFQTEGAAQEKERCPNVLVLTCEIHRVLGSEEEQSCGVESAHEEDQTNKQGLYQWKGSDRELITVIIDNGMCVYGGITTLDYL